MKVQPSEVTEAKESPTQEVLVVVEPPPPPLVQQAVNKDDVKHEVQENSSGPLSSNAEPIPQANQEGVEMLAVVEVQGAENSASGGDITIDQQS